MYCRNLWGENESREAEIEFPALTSNSCCIYINANILIQRPPCLIQDRCHRLVLVMTLYKGQMRESRVPMGGNSCFEETLAALPARDGFSVAGLLV